MEKQYTKEQEEKVLYYYVTKGRGQQYAAKQAKCSLRILKQILYDNNIHIRTFSEAAIKSNKNRAKKKNHQYFDVETPNMAWTLGFIASDGNVSGRDNTIKICLSAVDKEILERIKQELELEDNVKEYTTASGFDCVRLEWTSEHHKKKLAEYNIIPNKTFTFSFPTKLDKIYWIDFIRGYFDGDGSINYLQQKALRWQICSATKSTLETIVNFLYEEYNIPKVNILTKKTGDKISYYFQYSTNATKKIYNILYSTDSSMYLKRKKEHFTECVKKMF